MIPTYEALVLMISFSMLVLAVVNTIVNIIIQILRYHNHSSRHQNIKK